MINIIEKYVKLIQLNEKSTNIQIKKWTGELKDVFTKAIQVGNRPMKRCTAPLILREMQIKTMRYYLTHVRVLVIKKTRG